MKHLTQKICIGLITLLSAVVIQAPVKTVHAASSNVSVEWSTPNNTTVSGVFVIEASARASSLGSASVKKWCLTVDGSAVTSDPAVYDLVYSNVRYLGTFDSGTGCWSSSSNSLTTAQFRWDSTSWADGPRSYVVTVTDSFNRTATSATLTVNRIAPPAVPLPSASSAVVIWNETNDQFVTGKYLLSAQAAGSTSPSSPIRKWCLTVDGSPVRTNVNVPMSGANAAQNSLAYHSTFNSDTGCWTGSSTSLTTALFQWDSTSWANGLRSYVVSVTDSSNRTATSSTLTVNTVNYAPYTEWSSANNQTVTGTFELAGIATPHSFGTASIRKWCLTIDGSPVTTDVNVPMSGANSAQNSLAYHSTFGRDGCWSGLSNSLSTGMFRLNTAAWTNATRILTLTVTDSSGRTDSDTLSFTTNNPQPTSRVLGLSSGSTVRLGGTFGFEVYHPGATAISDWCVTVNSTTCLAASDGTMTKTGVTSTRSVTFDSSMWRNGTYTARSTARDSEGRSFDSGVITFAVINPGASGDAPKVRNEKPKWFDKTVKSNIDFYSSYATEIEVFWGTSTKKLRSAKYSTQGAISLAFTGLKPKTFHYVKARVTGPNGTSETSLVKFKTASIPPKPKPSYGGGSGGGSSGGSYVTRVVGLRLDIAMRLVPGARKTQASNCGQYGYENGSLGIVRESNWIVVAQSGRTLYVCKK